MKLIDLTCSKCGASLQVNPELTKCMCQYCGNEMLIDNEIQHHSLDNGFEFGYQAEIGRQQAQQEMQRQAIIQRQQIINEQNRRSQQIAEEHKQRTFHIWTITLLIIYPFIGIPMMFFDKRFNKDNRKVPIIIWSIIIIIWSIMGLISSRHKTESEKIVHPPNATLEQSSSSMLNESKGNITGFNTEDTVIQGYTVKDDEVIDDREYSLAEIAGEEIYNTEQIMNESEITNDKYEFTVVLWKYNSTCYLQSECEDIYIRNYKDTFIDGSYTINYIVQLPVGEYVIEFNEDSDFGNKSYNNQLGQFYKGKWYGYNQYTSEIVDSTGYDIKSVPDGTKSIYYEPDDWKPIDLKYYDYMEDEDDRIILEKDNTLNITEDCSILLNFDSNGECPLIFHKLK